MSVPGGEHTCSYRSLCRGAPWCLEGWLAWASQGWASIHPSIPVSSGHIPAVEELFSRSYSVIGWRVPPQTGPELEQGTGPVAWRDCARIKAAMAALSLLPYPNTIKIFNPTPRPGQSPSLTAQPSTALNRQHPPSSLRHICCRSQSCSFYYHIIPPSNTGFLPIHYTPSLRCPAVLLPNTVPPETALSSYNQRSISKVPYS